MPRHHRWINPVFLPGNVSVLNGFVYEWTKKAGESMMKKVFDFIVININSLRI